MARVREPHDPRRTTEADMSQLEEKGALSSSYADEYESHSGGRTTNQLLDSDDE